MNKLRRVVLSSLLLLPFTPAARAQMLVPVDPNIAPLAIKDQRVTVEVKDQLARTHLEQVFVSNSPVNLEATYVFPIPDDVAVSEFSMWMNGKKVTGEVLEADKARATYESIVARMRDPGLLEYAGRRLLRCRIFPVPAHGEQKIEVEYGEVVKLENGVARYVYPLATGGKSSRVRDNLSLKLALHHKGIKSVYSPTHKVSVDRKGDDDALVGFEEKGASLDRDFDLFWTVSDKDVGLNLLSFRDGKDDDGYFVLMMAPKAEVPAEEIAPKDVVLVLDNSGSMEGQKIEQAKKALKFVLGSLRAKDRFGLIRFSTGVETFEDGLLSADSEHIERAKKFVDKIEAGGGTAIDDALAEALKMTQKGAGERPQFVVFITDGEPTIGETDPQAILADAQKRAPKGVRIFTFGVGTDLNAVLLDALAEGNGGVPEYAAENEEIEEKISSFAGKINSPVMTDLAIDFGKTQTYDVYPKNIPDLFKGGEVTVFGRYKGSGGAGAMTLTGTVQGKKRSFTFEGSYAKEAGDPDDATSFIPRLWATRKVGYLLDEIRLHGEKPELREEVVSLARKWGIMTPYTSYLVAEDVKVATNQIIRTPPPPPPNYPRPMEERREDGWFGGAPGRASGGAAQAAPAMPPAAASDAVRSSTGDMGVAVSKKVKAAREKEQLDSDEVSNITRAGRHTFLWKDSTWIDDAYRGSEKLLKVKYLSPAWFALVRLHPELKAELSVGSRVVLVVGPGKAVVITDEGSENLSEGEIRAFF